MEHLKLYEPVSPDFQSEKLVKEFKFGSFMKLAAVIPPALLEGHDVKSIFDYMFELPKASQWLLTRVLSDRNYKTNIATVIGNTPYEKEMVKVGYKRLFEDGIICRIQRGKYMVNPSIVGAAVNTEEDALVNWNAHCILKAVLKFRKETLAELMLLDGRRFLEFMHQEKLLVATDTALKEFLSLAREKNWMDENNTPTGRASDDEGFERALVECRKRGLI